MSSVSLHRIASEGALRLLKPELLIEIIRPSREFFAGHDGGFDSAPPQLDYERLSHHLNKDPERVPPALVEALWCIHEVGHDENFDELDDLAAELKLFPDRGGPETALDLAAAIWLADQDAIHRLIVAAEPAKKRGFRVLMPRAGVNAQHHSGLEQVARNMTREAAEWYLNARRGPRAGVSLFERPDRIDFVVRHGAPYRRESTLTGTGAEAIHFRPLVYTSAILERGSGALFIASSAGIKETKFIAAIVGQYLFHDRDLYSFNIARYTLEPLRRQDAQVLTCSDCPDLQAVRLRSLTYRMPDAHGASYTAESDDLFKFWALCPHPLPEGCTLERATLEFTPFLMARPVKVTLVGDNRATYPREHAPLVEPFLARRGFIRKARHAARASA